MILFFSKELKRIPLPFKSHVMKNPYDTLRQPVLQYVSEMTVLKEYF